MSTASWPSCATMPLRKGFCWPGYASISKTCQLSRRTVARALVTPQKLDLITVRPPTKAGKSNTYTVSLVNMQRSWIIRGTNSKTEEGEPHDKHL